jgi:peptidyl-prolyl cis-trans isomerase D
MLKWVRKYSRSWVVAIAIGAIAVVFIFWGVGSMNAPQFNDVAVVNGTSITVNQYLHQYNELVKEYQERAHGDLNPEMIKMLRLKEMAVNRLIQEELLLQAGQRLGLQVTNAELQQQIQSYPFFKNDGKFDEKRYFWVLSRSRISPQEFEEQERRRLLLKKVLDDISSMAKASDAELQEAFRMEKEAVDVSFLTVSPEQFLAQIQPKEEEISKYYQEHQTEFKVPDRVRISYLLFRTKDFLERVKVTPEAVESYLQEHSDEFSRPKVIQARQILIPLSPQAKPEEQRQAAAAAAALQQKAQEGGDFAQLARDNSKDAASKDQGGELSAVQRGQHPAAWDRVAFTLRPGEIGQATTPEGIYLIKLEEVKETERLPEAAATVRKLLQEQLAGKEAKEQAEQAWAAFSGSSVAEVAKKFGVTPQETPLMSLRDPVAGLGVLPAFNRAALDLKPPEVSRVVSLPDGFAVLQCRERQAEHLPPLAAIKDQVREAVKKVQSRDRAQAQAEALLKELKAGKALAQVAAGAGLKVQETGLFTRSQGFMKQRQAQALTSAAFLLSKKNPYPAQPLDWQNRYYLLAFKDLQEPEAKDFEQERAKLKDQFLEQKRRLILSSWLETEYKRADIKMKQLP